MLDNKDWLKLDNAAKIYPALSIKKSPPQFRLTATLESPIHYSTMKSAWTNLLQRCPYFQVHLKRGMFWYYLQRHNKIPQIELMTPLPKSPFDHMQRTSHLLKLSIRDYTIALDFSHILTDGNGSMRFLKSLIYEYFKLKGTKLMSFDKIPTLATALRKEEYEDGYLRYFPGKLPAPESLSKAYHLSGKPFSQNKFRMITGDLSLEKMLALTRRKKVSITEYLVAIYLYSLVRLYNKNRKKGSSVIRLEVPVNLRKYFPSATMRNFSLYTSIEIDLKLGEYDFAEILKKVHHSMRIQNEKKELSRQVSRNVRGEINPFIRVIPVIMKNIYMADLYSRLGEKCYSGILSNLGPIELPENYGSYIRSFNFILSPNYVINKSITVLSWQNIMRINITSVINDCELERLFFTKLTEDGIGVSVKEISNVDLS